MKIIVTCGPSYEPIDEVRRRVYEAGGELADEGSIYALEAGVAAG